MKYKIENGYITSYYQDGTGFSMRYINENTIRDLYIISKNKANRYPIEAPKDLEEYTPEERKANFMEVDFYNLKAKVYDQYGDVMDIQPTFEIEGTVAEIQDNRVLEKEVEKDTSYFIVAKAGDLEQRQERTVYAPKEEPPSEVEILKKKIEALATEGEMTNDLLQEIILQVYSV